MHDAITSQRSAPHHPASAVRAPSFALQCVVCGVALPVPSGIGRPRLTCSTPCRRRRDHLNKKIERRRAWIEAWEQQAGRYAREVIRGMVRKLKTEIRELRRGTLTTRER